MRAALSEGVDVPSLDGVAFIDPAQQPGGHHPGRGSRHSPECGQEGRHDCIAGIYRRRKNAEDTIEASNFQAHMEVLDALKAHDDVLANVLDQIRTEMGKHSSKSVSSDGLRKISMTCLLP